MLILLLSPEAEPVIPWHWIGLVHCAFFCERHCYLMSFFLVLKMKRISPSQKGENQVVVFKSLLTSLALKKKQKKTFWCCHIFFPSESLHWCLRWSKVVQRESPPSTLSRVKCRGEVPVWSHPALNSRCMCSELSTAKSCGLGQRFLLLLASSAPVSSLLHPILFKILDPLLSVSEQL